MKHIIFTWVRRIVKASFTEVFINYWLLVGHFLKEIWKFGLIVNVNTEKTARISKVLQHNQVPLQRANNSNRLV